MLGHLTGEEMVTERLLMYSVTSQSGLVPSASAMCLAMAVHHLLCFLFTLLKAK
jgi:hypothetical protein